MRNLAGARSSVRFGEGEVDTCIRQELTEAGIGIHHVPLEHSQEVQFTLIGKLGQFVFKRGWYYWRVSGDVPIAVARKIYANPVGAKDVRAAGHCCCPTPEEVAHGGVVDHYHIDSQEGLNLFTKIIRESGLVIAETT